MNFLTVHGHFYQPPREDAFTGEVPTEPGAEPFHDFNEKILAECYRPNARLGNFRSMSFDVGPTLAGWLERHAPDTFEQIRASERAHLLARGDSNALAQAFYHTILPLSTRHEKQIQISWGIAQYEHTYGHQPAGMWLPETAVDLETLRALADAGITFTILAPHQSAGPVDPTEPYWIDLEDGRKIAAFFFHALSVSVSFDSSLTTNADQFSVERLASQLNPEKRARGEDQIILIATDGELYGHHQPFRDQFLARLFHEGARQAGFSVTSLQSYLRTHPPRFTTRIHPVSAWSCAHGVSRWSAGCSCTEGDATWKWRLRDSLQRLAAGLDLAYESEAHTLVDDPHRLLEDYVRVRLGTESLGHLLDRYAPALNRAQRARLGQLLESQYYRQAMFTSCAWFFEDLDRFEPRNNIGYAARALHEVGGTWKRMLEERFMVDIETARSWRTGRTGADLYRDVVAASALAPDLRGRSARSRTTAA